jgi:uncharacterized membrane protein
MMQGGMMDGMGSVMAWMMGVRLLAWVLVIGLLATIVVLLVQLWRRVGPRERPGVHPPSQGTGQAPN